MTQAAIAIRPCPPGCPVEQLDPIHTESVVPFPLGSNPTERMEELARDAGRMLLRVKARMRFLASEWFAVRMEEFTDPTARWVAALSVIAEGNAMGPATILRRTHACSIDLDHTLSGWGGTPNPKEHPDDAWCPAYFHGELRGTIGDGLPSRVVSLTAAEEGALVGGLGFSIVVHAQRWLAQQTVPACPPGTDMDAILKPLNEAMRTRGQLAPVKRGPDPASQFFFDLAEALRSEARRLQALASTEAALPTQAVQVVR